MPSIPGVFPLERDFSAFKHSLYVIVPFVISISCSSSLGRSIITSSNICILHSVVTPYRFS